MKTFLVDGSALLYRSHFAFQRQPLATSRGEVTSAAFGVLQALMRLIDEEGAEGLVVAFDLKGPTFRHELFPEYKAHRPPMPEELRAQRPRVEAIVDALGIPRLGLEGYEADDLIGTVAREGEARGDDIWIYSGDKDFIPLVRPGVGILKPAGRGGADEYLDEATLRQRLGLRPRQYLEVLALMGDKADNVPGVPGIGEKTALKLVKQFDSVEGLLARLPDKRVTPRQQKLLEEHREQLLLSRRLVTIDEHAPVTLDWEAARVRDPYGDALRELCVELEFHQLLRRLEAEDAGRPKDAGLRRYRWLTDLGELDEALDALRPLSPWAVDTETTSVDPMRAELVGISLSARAHEALYIPVDVSPSGEESGGLFASEAPRRLPWVEVRRRLAPDLADPERAKVGQNLKYDQIVLERHGAPLQGARFDTMIASYLLAPERRQHSMDFLAREALGERTIAYKELFEGLASKDIRDVPLERLGEYACEDADVTLRLYELFAPELEAEGLRHLMDELEMPLSQVLLRMERRGVRLDRALLGRISAEWGERQEKLVEEIHELAGGAFNLNSPKQLQEVLFTRLGLKPVKKTATGWSTDVDVLTRLADEHPLPAKLLDYRQLQKLLSTYVDALPRLVHPETGCVHTSYNQAVAATGRLSSTDPNLQNIPIRTDMGRRIREAFVPREEGWSLLAADYSQIELRLMAHLSGDEALRAAFERGEDIHARTAALVAGVELEAVDAEMRRRAKAINFGILYGMGARALAQQIQVSSKEAQGFIAAYFERLPRVRAFIDETIATAREKGEVRTIMGRRRRLPELASKDPRQRAFGERIAVNTPIQGSAADLIKLAMIRLDARLEAEGLAGRMLLQVHDELILEVRDDARAEVERAVREEMEQVEDLSVPLVVDTHFGRNWAEAHP